MPLDFWTALSNLWCMPTTLAIDNMPIMVCSHWVHTVHGGFNQELGLWSIWNGGGGGGGGGKDMPLQCVELLLSEHLNQKKTKKKLLEYTSTGCVNALHVLIVKQLLLLCLSIRVLSVGLCNSRPLTGVAVLINLL